MEGSSAATVSPQAPKSSPAAAGPDTRDDLKALRRWVLVAGIWAVAATVVALIALLDSSKGEVEQRASDAQQRAGEVEKRAVKLDRDQKGLATRIDEVESRLGSLAPLSDVSKLQDRVGRVEENASKASDKVGSSSNKVKSLEDRVAALENAPDSAATTGESDKKP